MQSRPSRDARTSPANTRPPLRSRVLAQTDGSLIRLTGAVSSSWRGRSGAAPSRSGTPSFFRTRFADRATRPPARPAGVGQERPGIPPTGRSEDFVRSDAGLVSRGEGRPSTPGPASTTDRNSLSVRLSGGVRPRPTGTPLCRSTPHPRGVVLEPQVALVLMALDQQHTGCLQSRNPAPLWAGCVYNRASSGHAEGDRVPRRRGSRFRADDARRSVPLGDRLGLG